MNKFLVFGSVAAAGVIGTGIYFSIPFSSQETRDISENTPLLSQEHQEAYKVVFNSKFSELKLLDYGDHEAWKEAHTRSLDLAYSPAGLEQKRDWKGARDWCYSIANLNWSDSDDEHVQIATKQVCQIPVAELAPEETEKEE